MQRHLRKSPFRVLSSFLFSTVTDNLDDAIFMLVKSVLKNLITSEQWQGMQTIGRVKSDSPNAIDKLHRLSKNQKGEKRKDKYEILFFGNRHQ